MRRPSFAAVLDEMLLACHEPAPPRSSSWTRTPAFGVPTTFLFARPLTAATPRWPTVAAASGAPARPVHRLDAGQRRAFERLIALGAELPAGFTADQLRREYRRLARRFHPDQHATCPPLERAQLARCFTDVAEAYRRLRPVVEPRH